MTAIRLTGFAGMSPAVASHALPDNGAQYADNCRLGSGSVGPLNEGERQFSLALAGEIKSLYRINDDAGVAWLAWTEHVDCVQGPIVGLGRYYYTGDGEPRVTTYALATAGSGGMYPAQFRVLGLARPVSAPNVSAAGGTAVDVSRYYCYTFYDDWDQESAPSPLSNMVTGKPDGTWSITGMDATPANTGGISALTYTDNIVTITSAVQHFNRVGETITIAGVTTVTNVNGTWVLRSADTAAKTMSFVVQSAPSGTYNSGTDAGASWTRVAPFGSCTKRIYRTSGSTAQFQLVADKVSGTSYNDTLSDANILGDELISIDWDMPPVDLRGLRVHPSGALVGYSDNELCFSEPYQPHAWPARYRMRTGFKVKGLGIFGTTIGVATDGVPYLVIGNEPGQMVADKAADTGMPCVSSRGVVSTAVGVVYPSAQGLVQIDSSGAQYITNELYTARQWEALDPYLMFGAHNNGVLYYGVTPNGGVPHMLVFGQTHSRCILQLTALYADKQTGLLYYVENNEVYAFDRPTKQYLQQSWWSKEYILSEPRTMTAAKIVFDMVIPPSQLAALQAAYNAALASNQQLVATGDIGGYVNAEAVNVCGVNDSRLVPLPELSNASAAVTFDLYVDGELKYSTTVTSSRPFRLPSGYKGTRFSVRVGSRCVIHAVELADNVVELKRV